MLDATQPPAPARPLAALPSLRARVATLAIAFPLAALGALAPRDLAERLCANGPTARAAIELSRLTAPLPTSLMELLIVALVLWAVVKLARGGAAVARRRAPLGRSLAAGGLWVAAVLSVALATFVPLFGVAYARRPLPERLGWSDAARAPTSSAAELERLASELVDDTNAAYEAVAGSPDLGRPSAPSSPEALDQALEQAYGRIEGVFGLDASVGERRGPAKTWLATRIFSTVGLGGVYCPWTGEANVNAEEPWCERAHTTAHEKAHQRLFASEDEANFVGFLACALSDDPYARYSGRLFAQRSLLRELVAAGGAAGPLLARRHKGVQRDVNDFVVFVQAHDGPVTHAAAQVNHVYLKANGVVGGAQSYSLSSRLLVGLARSRGGTLRGLGARQEAQAGGESGR